MNRERSIALLASVLACCVSVTAQDRGIWRATSSSAQSITGDVAISGDKLSIDYTSFTIAPIRALEPGEVGAAFDMDSSSVSKGNLYRLNIPGTKRFMHKNTLCGSEDIQWMASYAAGNYLHLAFFSGQKMPILTPEAIANTTDLCGTFSYAR
jgi:hypothetical protein